MSLWGVGASVVGSLIQADSADDAIDAQTRAANSDRELQKYIYDQTRTDQGPYRDAGYSALNRLSLLLGLTPEGSSFGSEKIPKVRTYDQIRASLLPKYTTGSIGNFGGFSGLSRDSWLNPVGRIDEERLGREIQAVMEAESKAAADAKARVGASRIKTKDPDFGLLTRRFTGSDLLTEPGYQFGLDQGSRAIQRNATAAGSNFSGATLKALQRYSQDYAGTKFGEAFNRDAAYKDSLFNRLSGVSGTGQTATNTVNQAGANYANNVGNTMIGLANAQGASAVNRGNIFSNGINSVISAWQRGGGQSPQADPYGYDYRGTMLPDILRGGG